MVIIPRDMRAKKKETVLQLATIQATVATVALATVATVTATTKATATDANLAKSVITGKSVIRDIK